MADILIAAYGSRGDIMPLADIGLRLRDAGHRTVLTTNADLVDEVEELGLTARGVPFDLDDDGGGEPSLADALQLVRPAGMRRLGANLLAAVDDVPADAVLLSPFAELAGHALAEARGVPSLGLRLQPLSTTAAYPPSLSGAWTAGAMLNRAAGRLAAGTVDRVYGGVSAGFRADLGLSARSARAQRRARTAAGWPILHGHSPAVLPRPADWRTGLEVVGYWWSPTPPGWTPPAELTDFLAAGPPPVFLGFGSLMVPAKERARLERVIADALTRTGARAVVQSGGAGLRVDADRVLTIGAVPYEWLFPRVAAVVHSCGAGTAAAGLRAGVPTVPVPSPGVDQLFWARRLHALGAATAPLPRPKLSAVELAAAIDAAVTDLRYRDSASRLAGALAIEDGAGAVVERVERLVAG